MKKGIAEVMVDISNTAASLGSGFLPVFATPALVALMEKAACNAFEGELEEGCTSVGIFIGAEHLAATPVGMKVTATAELIETDGKIFTFTIEACDEVGVVGKATHKRAIVQVDRFMAKAEKRGRDCKNEKG